MNGLILINKPKGYTSHDIVNVIRKTIGIKKVGHTGTLDPNATGILPILIGEATKTSKYLIEHKKTYVATLKLGEQTSTGDSQGDVIKKSKIPNISIKQLKDALNSFLGIQLQIPPIYSAVKVDGKKLYEYARKGKKVDIPSRQIEIYRIDLIDFNNNDLITFEVECSKGTYIRTLCEDIAKELDTIGYMKELKRIKVNDFRIEDSISIENVTKENIEKHIITLEDIFKDKDKIELDDKKNTLFLNGVKLSYNLQDEVYRIYNNQIFIGIGVVKDNVLKRDIIII